MADATDLKSVDPKGSCGFESRHRHQDFKRERLLDLIQGPFSRFRVKPIKHPRYRYVVYRIADGRRVEQAAGMFSSSLSFTRELAPAAAEGLPLRSQPRTRQPRGQHSLRLFPGNNTSTVAAYNATTGAVISDNFVSLPSGASPKGLAVSGNTLYVLYVASGGDYICAYDATTGVTLNANLVSGVPKVLTYLGGGMLFVEVFVIGANGHLYMNYWDGAAWEWIDQGVPPGTTATGAPGLISPQLSPRRPVDLEAVGFM
jgi:hypothetical protein